MFFPYFKIILFFSSLVLKVKWRLSIKYRTNLSRNMKGRIRIRIRKERQVKWGNAKKSASVRARITRLGSIEFNPVEILTIFKIWCVILPCKMPRNILSRPAFSSFLLRSHGKIISWSPRSSFRRPRGSRTYEITIVIPWAFRQLSLGTGCTGVQ